MKGLPYFCWYPADAETDENFRAMTDSEVGFYIRCLNHSWINEGLPTDPAARARAMGRTKALADKMWIRVGECFAPDPENPTRLINPRQEIERADAIAKRIASRDAGRKSGEARRQKSKLQSNGSGRSFEPPSNLVRTHAYDSDSVSVFESKSEEVRNSSEQKFEVWRIDENFVNYRESYLKAGAVATDDDWTRAWWEWKTLDLQQKLNAIAYAAQCDPAWVKQPQNILKSREWTRPERPTPRSKSEIAMGGI